MKTRLLGLAVVLVAVAVIVNAMALSSFTQTNAFTLNVVSPDMALIAFDTVGAAVDKDVTVSLTNDRLSLAFAHGVQKNATYEFSPVFQIKNNSKNAVNIGWAAGPGAPAGTTVTSLNADGGAPLTSLAAESEWVTVAVKVVTDGTAAGGGTYNATFTATRP